MSKVAGEKYLNALLNTAIEKLPAYKKLKDDYRTALNTSIHVLDISEISLQSNLEFINNANVDDYKQSYSRFITLVKDKANSFKYQSHFEEAIKSSSITALLQRGSVFIENKKILISSSFGAARAFITSISVNMRNDPYFGIVNRARTLSELEFQEYEISKENLASIEEQEAGISAYYCKTPGNSKAKLRYFNSQGTEISKQNGKELVRNLSIFDLGHTFQSTNTRSNRVSPLSTKLTDAIKVTSSPEIKSLLGKALEDLANIQASVEYTYENTIPKKLLNGRGILTLSLHVYNRNNKYARAEGAIYNSLISSLKDSLISSLTAKQLASVPGSNTMLEDASVIAIDRIKSVLSGTKVNNLKPHSKLSGTVKSNPTNTKQKINTSSIAISKKSTPSIGKKPNTTNISINLTSLQMLINRHLQDVISANMGDGNERRILNYRTGRLAASAKVERLSQSREGMITAFYTYMKNPYATFSEGGRQQYPKTRDPKLLIGNAIKEIAATQVGARLRAVVI